MAAFKFLYPAITGSICIVMAGYNITFFTDNLSANRFTLYCSFIVSDLTDL